MSRLGDYIAVLDTAGAVAHQKPLCEVPKIASLFCLDELLRTDMINHIISPVRGPNLARCSCPLRPLWGGVLDQ